MLALLALIAAQIFLCTQRESQTFDESDHLYSGYEYWKHGDFGHNPEHPPLAKLVAGSGLLALQPKDPGPSGGSWFKIQDFRAAHAFLYEFNPSADALLMRGRAMMLLFALGLGLAVFAAGREMFSPQAGLLALTLFAFEPSILANGGLITTDMALSCMLFATVYAFYRYVKRPTLLRATLLGVAVGLALVAKQSGVFVYFVLAILAAAEFVLGFAVSESSSGAALRRTGASLAVAVLVSMGVSYFLLWGFYGFRYAARPAGIAMVPTIDVYAAAVSSHIERAAILFFARHHLVPEAYLYGWCDILQIPGVRASFLLGKLYIGGKWFLFPAIVLMKSTIALLVLLVLVPFARLWRYRREFLSLAIPATTYLLIAAFSGMNAESRYILPIYPFLIVLAGAAAWEFGRRSRAWGIALAALFVYAAGSSLHAFPDYLAYANEAFGGPSNSYRLMSDSNGDWAQGLKWTKGYLDANHITDCWFDYSDPLVDPAYYGIPCKPLTSAWVHRGIPGPIGLPATISGTVLISASELDGHLWGPGVLNPYEQFSHLRPDAKPGNIVLAYHGTFNIPLVAAYSRLAAAAALTRAHRFDEAIAQARQAVQLAPESADMQTGLGDSLTAVRQTAEARQAYATAQHLRQTIHPEFQGAK